MALFSEVGENVNAHGATIDGSSTVVCLCERSTGSGYAKLLITNPIAPVLVIVTICGALVVPTGYGGNVKTEGDRVADGTAASPLSATVCGLPGELSFPG